MPLRLTWQPENVVTPADSALVQPLNTAPAGPVPLLIDSVTVLAYPVATLPYASLAVTTGWVVNEAPAVTPAGWVVNVSEAAPAAPTVNDPETPVKAPCVAVRVVVCASNNVMDGLPMPLEK